MSETYNFSIDEIFPKHSIIDGIFRVKIIPDIESRYYPPYLLRTINISFDLLSKGFYLTMLKKYGENNIDNENDYANADFLSVVEQGGYYEIPRENISREIFKDDYVVNRDNNIFKKAEKNLYEVQIDKDKTMSVKEGVDILRKNGNQNGKDPIYLYCFNVGQGDSLLLIMPSKNAYVIDTNYYGITVDKHIEQIDRILERHGIKNINGLFITHKHLDHIRGAVELLKRTKINSLLINDDYKHDTKPYNEFINASNDISHYINVNENISFNDGDAEIGIINPDKGTNNSTTPDINDSSICLIIKKGETKLLLTGDVGYNILNDKLEGEIIQNKNMLKVSHHGSVTGTNEELLKKYDPSKCFISVGNSKKYNHPSSKVVSWLNEHMGNGNVKISRRERQTVGYKFDGSEINYVEVP